jgi:hypothetical protein
MPSVFILVPSSTPWILRFGLLIMSPNSWRLSSCLFFSSLLYDCLQSLIFFLLLDLLYWWYILIYVIRFIKHFISNIYIFFSESQIPCWISHPFCWYSCLGLELTSLLHLSICLNLIWAHWSVIKIKF